MNHFLYLIIYFYPINYIIDYSSLREDTDNQSDHAPVVLSLIIYLELHSYTPVTHTPRKKWNDANHGQINNYKSILDDKLSITDIPYDCINCTIVF